MKYDPKINYNDRLSKANLRRFLRVPQALVGTLWTVSLPKVRGFVRIVSAEDPSIRVVDSALNLHVIGVWDLLGSQTRSNYWPKLPKVESIFILRGNPDIFYYVTHNYLHASLNGELNVRIVNLEEGSILSGTVPASVLPSVEHVVGDLYGKIEDVLLASTYAYATELWELWHQHFPEHPHSTIRVGRLEYEYASYGGPRAQEAPVKAPPISFKTKPQLLSEDPFE